MFHLHTPNDEMKQSKTHNKNNFVILNIVQAGGSKKRVVLRKRVWKVHYDDSDNESYNLYYVKHSLRNQRRKQAILQLSQITSAVIFYK